MSGTKSALVMRGGWDGHFPVECTELFIPFLREHDYEVRIADDPEVYAEDGYLESVDLILQCYTMGTIEPKAVQSLRDAVAAGTGLAGWHGGIADSFRSCSDYLQLIGGQFAGHPGKHPSEQREGDSTNYYLRHTVDIVPEKSEHPIVAGLSDFELDTEQYWVLTDEYCDVLATTTHAAPSWRPWHREVTCPAVWTRNWGEGRIFVATPGHTPDILQHGDVRTLVERGLLWASR